MKDFEISSEDCMIVLQFQSGASLREVAARIKQDPSALARRVQRIASEHAVLVKVKGRWQLTERGYRLCEWTQDCLISQKRALERRPRIRLASTMGLSEKLITPGFEALDNGTGSRFDWIVVVPKDSLEGDLLAGRCDLVIACHAPTDPGIAHKKSAKEEWVIAMPASWKNELSLKGQALDVWGGRLKGRPYIRHQDIDPQSYLSFPVEELSHRLMYDHIIGVRAAVAAGLGWSVLPLWLVAEDVRLKKIHSLDLPSSVSTHHICLWWMRDRSEIKSLVPSVTQWLRAASETMG